MDTINLTQQHTALRFITCGSVDDGKSTLIGRLLVDSKSVLQDHLAGVQRHGATDLALLTDGLSAEASKASPSTWLIVIFLPNNANLLSVTRLVTNNTHATW